MIKAFSTISAYSLESDVAGERRQVYVSGNDRNAVDLVVQLAESIGFSAIRQGSLGAGQALEKDVTSIVRPVAEATSCSCYHTFSMVYLRRDSILFHKVSTLQMG